MQGDAEQSINTEPYGRDERPSVVIEPSDTAAAEVGSRAPIHAVVPSSDGTRGRGAKRPATLAAIDSPMASRTRRLLEAPIAPTLLRLAAPTEER